MRSGIALRDGSRADSPVGMWEHQGGVSAEATETIGAESRGAVKGRVLTPIEELGDPPITKSRNMPICANSDYLGIGAPVVAAADRRSCNPSPLRWAPEVGPRCAPPGAPARTAATS